jgi:hypothetical protein
MGIETISVTFTRDQLGGKGNPKFNLFMSGVGIVKSLLEKRIPAIGIDGVILVERGELTIRHEDGLDGDEWTYTFVGEPIMKELMPEVRKPGFGLSLQGPTLREREAAMRAKLVDDEEL